MTAPKTQYQHKADIVEQFRHVDATPLLLNEMEEMVKGTVRHIYDQAYRAVKEVEDLRAEVKALRALCRANGIKVPKAKKARAA